MDLEKYTERTRGFLQSAQEAAGALGVLLEIHVAVSSVPRASRPTGATPTRASLRSRP